MSARIRIEHIRSARICMRGARAWFESKGLSWTDFLRDGIEMEAAEKMDDPFAKRVLAEAQKEVTDGHG